MCYGQFLDMMGEGKHLTAEELDEINNSKTGALLGAACLLGAAAAGADERQRKAAESFGVKLGLAFQIRDDMLDVLSTDEEIYGQYYSMIEDNISKTYLLQYSESEQCTSIVSGYFQRK